jgi:hydrogenase-1 operon protein HyaF
MSDLEHIAVAVEPIGSAGKDWGNALPILHEIRHGLERLAQTSEPTLIDLHAIPFGPGDEERLLEFLGRGEVQAGIEALGTTRVWESEIPGVWLVDHRNGNNERVALHIEINRIPDILRTQSDDILEAVARLDARLGAHG